MTAARKCPRCRRAAVRERGETGRTMAYRVFADLALPDDVPITTCVECSATYFDAATIAALGPTLTNQYNKRLLGLARAALRQIKQHLSHRRLELLMGVSQGYLSRVKTKPVFVSAPLVALLMLIAESPAAHLAALRRCWASAWNEGSEEHDRTDGNGQLANGRKAGEHRGKPDASAEASRVCGDVPGAAEADHEQGRKGRARRRAGQQIHEGDCA
ncbi:MAG: hypothetical protein JNM83_24305 [Myxococcales bacterium]|nr:hypothetical protein [Myxococcales bacterium]